ncbi:MAG TPA: hypothetical protein V6C76_10060 [Drouetiella sp.]
MDLFTAVFIVPEAFLLALGFFALFVSFSNSKEAAKIKAFFNRSDKAVDSTYWGQYLAQERANAKNGVPSNTVAASRSQSAASGGINLPTIKHLPE